MKLSAPKNQSAIEYLMTYGWISFVIAVIGIATASTLIGDRANCQREVKGLESEQLQLNSFEITSESARLELQNLQEEAITLNWIYLKHDNSSRITNISVSETIGPMQNKTLKLKNIERPKDCGSYRFSLSYGQENNRLIDVQLVEVREMES